MIAAFDAVCPKPPVQRKRLLGAPCALLNGNLLIGVYRNLLWIRLDEDARRELLAIDDAKPFEPVQGRPDPECVVVPRAWLREPERLEPWLERAVAYVESLEPKRARS